MSFDLGCRYIAAQPLNGRAIAREPQILALLAISITVGASSVLAGRNVVPHEELLRSAGLWALMSFMGLLFCPVLGFFFFTHSEWSLMYLSTAADLAVPLWLLTIFPLPLSLIGFLLARTWLAHDRLWQTLSLLGGSAVVGLAVLFFGQDRLLNVGTVERYIAQKALVPIGQTPLAYLVLAAGAALGFGWLTMLWRLFILARTSEVVLVEEDEESQDTINRPARKKPIPSGPGTKRKVKAGS